MYIPGQTRATQPAEELVGYTPGTAKVDAPELGSNFSPSYIAPELQARIDEAAQKMESEPKVVEEQSAPIASAEDWGWLRKKRDEMLEATDTVNGMSSSLSFEQRGELYKYRQALRDLPAMLGERWTRESVVWPTKPA